MKITKYGHACLMLEDGGVRVLLDPGNYSSGQNSLTNIQVIVITHVHPDHIDPNSLRKLLSSNPQAIIITNESVRSFLKSEDFAQAVVIVGDGDAFSQGELKIEGVGRDHALFHETIPCVENTGYFIGNRFFYPGDAFVMPKRPVEILALPVAAPWMKLPEAINYALAIKPKMCFPVHDAILKAPGSTHTVPPIVLDPAGIDFRILELEKSYEF